MIPKEPDAPGKIGVSPTTSINLQHQRKFALRIVLVPGAFFLVGICIGAVGSLGLATANLDNWSQWARDFAKSPGPAAFVALMAALIAYRGISKQVSVAHNALSHQQQTAKNASWWEVFQWASGRAVPERNVDVPLPDEITIDTLKRLALEATNDVQQTACAGMIDFLTARSLENNRAAKTSAEGLPSEAQRATESALARYVTATQGTLAASSMAEAFVYEAKVLEALNSIVDQQPSLRSASAQTGQGPFDSIFLVDEVEVGVELRWSQEKSKARSSTRRYLERYASRRPERPILIISPFDDLLTPQDQLQFRAFAVRWEEPKDNDAIVNGLVSAMKLAPSKRLTPTPEG